MGSANCPKEVGYTGGRTDSHQDLFLLTDLNREQADTHHGVVSRPLGRASQQNVRDGPGLATDRKFYIT